MPDDDYPRHEYVLSSYDGGIDNGALLDAIDLPHKLGQALNEHFFHVVAARDDILHVYPRLYDGYPTPEGDFIRSALAHLDAVLAGRDNSPNPPNPKKEGGR